VLELRQAEHHPTDILGSLLFAALWLTATSALIKPSADRHARQDITAVGRAVRPGTAAVRQ